MKRKLSFFLASLIILFGYSFQPVLASSPVRVLIVPGHDPVNWGTDYRGVKEADLTLALGEKLFDWLNEDPAFQVFSARDFATGDYNFGFANYFEANAPAVAQFRDLTSRNFDQAIASGTIKLKPGAPHNFANSSTAYILNAINKWANDNAIDVVVNLHFNDYRDRGQSRPGIYNGLAVYTPESQFGNSRSSQKIAQGLFDSLKAVEATSTNPAEALGVVPDQELIAIGSKNSRTGASVLIEYGYVYETAISTPTLRPLFVAELAYRTYLGLKRALGQETSTWPETTLLPYAFDQDLQFSRERQPRAAVLRLERVLELSGFYPPPGEDLASCPLSGIFGPCTRTAVANFQIKSGLPATGYVGSLTRSVLNGQNR